MKNDEFYIGWIAKEPNSIRKFIRKYLVIIFTAVLILAILLGLSQKKFSTGNFEFGISTQIKGIYFEQPVPNIKTITGRDIWGNQSFITIPLIGYGKHGAEGIVKEIEKERNISLNEKAITMKGTLLYNDGKLLMQIDPNENPLIRVGPAESSNRIASISKDLGTVSLKGEIVDPKCYFGVMKPGEGKPHQDCAIRCILGGMAPVLKVSDDVGRQNYYLLVGPHGERINGMVKDYIAEPVEIRARAVQYNDWVVLYMNDRLGIRRYSYLQENFKNSLQSCSTICLK